MNNLSKSHPYTQQQATYLGLETILLLLHNKTGYNPRLCGSGYKAGCPAHNDKYPSLSVTERDGKILLHCFNGCTIREICEALGIEVKDLFLTSKRGSSYG